MQQCTYVVASSSALFEFFNILLHLLQQWFDSIEFANLLNWTVNHFMSPSTNPCTFLHQILSRGGFVDSDCSSAAHHPASVVDA